MRDVLPLAHALSVALKSVQMYTSAHPRSQEGLDHALALFRPWLEEARELQMVAASGKAFIQGQPVDVPSPHLAHLVRVLTERHISGLLFQSGLTRAELASLLEALLLKPRQIEEHGGFEAVLSARGVQRIQVTQVQYREVRDGVEQTEQESGGWAVPRSEGPEPGHGPPETLVALVRGALLNVLPPSKGGAEGPANGPPALRLEPADLSGLSQMGYQLGLGEEMPTAAQMGVLRQVLMELPPERQLDILAGLGSLPGKPKGLAMGLMALAPEILAVASGSLVRDGLPLEHLEEPVHTILAPMPDRPGMLQVLGAHLATLGVPPIQLQAFIRHLEWEGLSLESRLRRVLEEGDLLDTSLERILELLRELLDQGRNDPFQRILERIIQALDSEHQAHRTKALQVLGETSRWTRERGFPNSASTLLEAGISEHFIKQSDIRLHAQLAETLGRLLEARLHHGDLQGLVRSLRSLRRDGPNPRAKEALPRLEAALLHPACLESALAPLFTGDREEGLAATREFFEWAGPTMARQLILALAEEKDRPRRGRIMEALKAFGPGVVPLLQERLSHPEAPWFLLRNMLNLLPEVAGKERVGTAAPLLRHGEPRVRRAAARSLWKLGGSQAEGLLLGALGDADPETRLEIVFGLGQMRSAVALPYLMDLLEHRRSPETLRLKVLDVLPLLPSAPALPVLLRLAKRRGLFGGSEPQAIRLAAARTLLALGPEGRKAVGELAEGEPRGEVRDAFKALLS